MIGRCFQKCGQGGAVSELCLASGEEIVELLRLVEKKSHAHDLLQRMLESDPR